MKTIVKMWHKFHNSTTYTMLKRAALRSIVLAILLLAAGWALETMVSMAHYGDSNLAQRFPEILIIFRATAILVWFNLSLFWIRLATQPSLGGQEAGRAAMDTPMSAAILFCAQTLKWMFEMALLMQLCGFWQ